MRNAFRASLMLPCASLVALLAACATTGGNDTEFVLQSRSGSSVTGSIRLRDTRKGLRITGAVSGLAPGSEHGFHLHDKGDCSAADASSAGPHFNPAGTSHGRMGSGAHHAGDIPNIRADEQGVAKINVTVPGISITGSANSAAVTGRAVIVHRDADDYTSQPAGNAGPRVACGVIL